jgi:hypothetical protein
MKHKTSVSSRLVSALLAGSIAIILNTLALKAADLISLPTAHGGLLRLVSLGFSGVLQQSGISSAWNQVGAPAPSSPTFQVGFHIFVGLMMSIFYAFVLEPLMPWGATAKGFVYALGLWLINAIIILPSTGEGFAGMANLSAAGILWFATAHTLFFMLLAYGFELLERVSICMYPEHPFVGLRNSAPQLGRTAARSVSSARCICTAQHLLSGCFLSQTVRPRCPALDFFKGFSESALSFVADRLGDLRDRIV